MLTTLAKTQKKLICEEKIILKEINYFKKICERKSQTINLKTHKMKLTGEINITIQIDRKIRKKKAMNDTPSVELVR